VSALRTRLAFLLAPVALIVTSCGEDENEVPDGNLGPPSGSSGAPVQQTPAQLEASGALLSLDRSSDIQGPDTNRNGVRDDIDRFINAGSYSPTNKSAVDQLARAFQSSILSDISNQSELESSRVNIARSVHCLFVRFTPSGGLVQPAEILETLQKITFNTKPRVLASIRFDNANNGTVLPRVDGDTCDQV
jgi:hypothetical protein